MGILHEISPEFEAELRAKVEKMRGPGEAVFQKTIEEAILLWIKEHDRKEKLSKL